jgi:hypothetical protein
MYNGSITSNAVTPSVNMKSRIINGAMVIDQRNAGASVTPTNGQFSVDRWEAYLTQASKYSLQQDAGAVTPPAGFTNYLGATSLSAYSVAAGDIFGVRQQIEGFNTADLGWGTANAKTVTLSFWVRSSLTGTFGGSLSNSAWNRSYPFTYTISSANTWEQKSITIAGDTSGTWLTTNGVGIRLLFGLGVGSTFNGTAGSWSGNTFASATGATSVVGTNGATFYITGVQLEVGSTATSFDYRPYGTEFQLCMRYYYKLLMNEFGAINGFCDNATNAIHFYQFPVPMRTSPTLGTSGTAADYAIRQPSTGAVACNAVPAIIGTASVGVVRIQGYTAGSLTTNSGCGLAPNGGNTFLAFAAEL